MPKNITVKIAPTRQGKYQVDTVRQLREKIAADVNSQYHNQPAVSVVIRNGTTLLTDADTLSENVKYVSP